MIHIEVHGDEFFLRNKTTGILLGPFDTMAMVAGLEHARVHSQRTGVVAPFEMVTPIGRQEYEGNGPRIERALARTGIDLGGPALIA